jgi:hypothetical protein
MRNDIVIIFIALCFIAVVIFMFRFVFHSGTAWGEDILERINRRKPASRLLTEVADKPRERLTQIALALALAPYHWPARRSGNDEGLSRAHQRYVAFLASMTDEDLRNWIKEKIEGTHSLLLKVTLESLESESCINPASSRIEISAPGSDANR